MDAFGSVTLACRRLAARARWVHWLVVAVCAAIAGLVMMRAVHAAEVEARAWGSPVAVVVATGGVPMGEPFAGRVEVIEVPAPVVPAGALRSLTELAPAAVALQRVGAGEIVVAHDVVPVAAPAALIPDGWLAVPIVEQAPSGAVVGDRVAIAADGTLLTRHGMVVGTRPESNVVVVALPETAAPAAAEAAAARAAMILVAPPPGPTSSA